MRQKGFAPITILIALAVIGYFGYKIVESNMIANQPISSTTPPSTTDHTSNWNTYSNDMYSFNIQYPTSIRIEEKNQNPKGSLHLYFMKGEVEVFRLHVTRNYKYQISEFYKESMSLNDIEYDIDLYPAGLDTGDFRLTKPILNYNTYKKGIEYSFEFIDRDHLNDFENQILSTFKIVDSPNTFESRSLEKGWYYGHKESKYSWTPDDWTFDNVGTKSECWHAPGIYCGST